MRVVLPEWGGVRTRHTVLCGGPSRSRFVRVMLPLIAARSMIGCMFGVVLIAVIVPLGMADEADAASDEKDTQIEALIEQLTSPNQQPPGDTSIDPRDLDPISTDYDKKAQKKVMAAWERLAAMGEKAFPSLIAHLGDGRYSYTYVTGPGARYNQSVGDACAKILGNSINAYRPLARPLFTGKTPEFFPYAVNVVNRYKTSADLKKWFAERRGKELWELQVEAARWAIENEKDRGLCKDDPPPLGAPLKSTRDIQKELDHAVKALKSLVKKLGATKKPVPVAVKLPEGVIGVTSTK